MSTGLQGIDGKVGVDRLPVESPAESLVKGAFAEEFSARFDAAMLGPKPRAPWLQQLDAIQAAQARIEAKLDTLIKALAEDLDEVSQSLDDGRTVARRRDEGQGL